jgi:glycine oxidase
MSKAAMGRSGAFRVAVVGGGIIGLSIAWRLSREGIRVDLFEAGEPGGGASHAAAGMLSVVAEAEPDDESFFELCRASRALWPAFAENLQAATGVDVGLSERGTLLVATTDSERSELESIAERHRSDGVLVALDRDAWRSREPHLNAGGAVYLAPKDGQADNRATTAALVRAFGELGELQCGVPIARLIHDKGRVVGVETAHGRQDFDVVVVATALGTNRLLNASALEHVAPPVSPVKGELIALQMDPAAPLVHHVVRSRSHYLVPRGSGRLIIGATSEPGVDDIVLTQRAAAFLKSGAERLIPALATLGIVDHWAGLRPKLPSGLPLIGEAQRGLLLALGHYRNGILLAPVTAELVAGALGFRVSGELQGLAKRFSPDGRQSPAGRPPAAPA